jgi:hypothetical protein
MTHTAREAAENTPWQKAVKGLIEALNWEHHIEKKADPARWAPRMIV